MLEDHIISIREGLKQNRYANESSVSQGIVLRLLQALLWPVYDTEVVHPEYPLAGRRVDYALCYPVGKPVVFIKDSHVHDLGSRWWLDVNESKSSMERIIRLACALAPTSKSIYDSRGDHHSQAGP